MPCMDSGPSQEQVETERRAARLKEQEYIDLQRWLCATCQALVHHQIPVPDEVRPWWEQHQRVDAERLAREAREREAAEENQRQADRRREVLASIASKLTEEERRAIKLGVD